MYRKPVLYKLGQPVVSAPQAVPTGSITGICEEWQDPTVKLLIVDDSPEIRAALRNIAGQLQHVVVGEAENGKEALRLVPQTRPDMVLLDISMPVMGGFATARELRQIAPELPIVFISQYADEDCVTEAFGVGARGYLLKSAIYSELSLAIESVANQKEYRSAQLVG